MNASAPRPVALVTGAGGGIGAAVARRLAADGFAIVACDLPGHAGLAGLVDGIVAAGGQATALQGDISDTEALEALVAAAWRCHGRIDTLVNNAGVSVKVRGDLLDVTPESFDRLIAINLRGTFFLTQAIARRMLAAPSEGFRSIITISSANAAAASLDRGEYCISKSGLSMMVKLFALRLAEAGIRVYEIRPGVIRTPMTAVAQAKYDARYAAGFTPINRWGEPEDIARGIAALAGGQMAFSTGDVVNLDGGLHIATL